MRIRKTTQLCLTVLLTLLIVVGCKSSENKGTQQESTAHIAIANKKLGENAQFTFNEDRSYVLAQSTPAANSDNLSFSFFVFDLKKEKVVLEQQVESGFVKWLSNVEIEVFRTPGKMRNDQTRDDYTQVYNVVTGDSMPKTDWKK